MEVQQAIAFLSRGMRSCEIISSTRS